MPYKDIEMRRKAAREAQARYRLRHPDKVLAAVRRWQEAHPEKQREYARKRDPEKKAANLKRWRKSKAGRRWIALNLEKRAKQAAARRALLKRKDPEQLAKQERKWANDSRARHRAEVNARRAAQRRANPEPFRKKDRERSANRRAKRKEAPLSHTVAEWKAVLRHWKRRCIYCGKKFGRRDVSKDHLIPLARGGDNSIRNIRPACRRCNSSKGTRTHEEYVTLPNRFRVPDPR
jgi:5-methylcytosine-specific restriction endonuclease McrA